jgi:hypothetical protein
MRLRSWWFHRQGLDSSLTGASAAQVLERSGWARSVGGVGPYLTLFARARIGRQAAEAALAAQEIHELPSARGCTYVLPRRDFALGLRVGRAFAGAEMKTAQKLGVGDQEIAALEQAVLKALAAGPKTPDEIRAAVGDATRSLGEEGKKKGLTTTLPVALGRLQVTGEIRRIPVDGRLDNQRYRYACWSPNPLAAARMTDAETMTALARLYFGWIGPATMAEFQWFSGLGVKAARDAVAPLGLEVAAGEVDRFILPEDARAWREWEPPSIPQYALVGGLDAMAAHRRDISALLDDADRDRRVSAGTSPVAGFYDLPHHAILDRGRLIGYWEYDPDAARIVAITFDGKVPPALAQAIERTEAFVRDELGDARAFSLDGAKSRGQRIAMLRRSG